MGRYTLFLLYLLVKMSSGFPYNSVLPFSIRSPVGFFCCFFLLWANRAGPWTNLVATSPWANYNLEKCMYILGNWSWNEKQNPFCSPSWWSKIWYWPWKGDGVDGVLSKASMIAHNWSEVCLTLIWLVLSWVFSNRSNLPRMPEWKEQYEHCSYVQNYRTMKSVNGVKEDGVTRSLFCLMCAVQHCCQSKVNNLNISSCCAREFVL